MAVKTLQALIAASQNNTNVVFTNEVLARAAENAKKIADDRAVVSAQAVLGTFQQHLNTNVLYLRQARESVKQYEKIVGGIDRAYRYFAETCNPLPMFKVMGYTASTSYVTNFFQPLGVPVPAADNDAWTIPDDWSPAKDEDTTTAAA